LFDWLRVLYARLRYVVHHDGHASDLFRALAGILIGDPASPILWNLFLSDLAMRQHVDDSTLAGVSVSHLEQADDIVVFSTSMAAVQSKLNDLMTWCSLNFAYINAIKTKYMVFGPRNVHDGDLCVNGRQIDLVDSYTYVGICFSTAGPDIFAQHTAERAAAARRTANVCLSIETYVAQLPPWAALTLYQSHIDPHLIYGCEVVLDARKDSPTPLVRVQHTYLRRVLGLTSRSRTSVLFTETGVWPITYRRISLALRYVVYLLNSRHPLPLAALADSRSRALMGEGSWLGDLRLALRRLPVAVDFNLAAPLSQEYIDETAKRVQLSLSTHLLEEMMYKEGLPLLRARPRSHQVLAHRGYLAVRNKQDRLALCRLLAGDSPLAIVQLRRRGLGIQRNRRRCRFCNGFSTVEDEIHVLLEC
ncbi:hypothetical protein FOMPIDRAFT_1085762, partial [Fomitopsis schrenkii]